MPEKCVLITGAASGIGLATARLFAAQGWRVAALDLDAAGLEALGRDLGENCLPVAADVTDPEGARLAVDRAGQWSGGRLDALINNAGVLYMGPFGQVPLERDLRTVAVNLAGPVACTHAALPLLRAAGGAAVVNVSSASAIHGIPELSVYGATKAALKSLTEAWRIEFAPLGVRVADVLPPFVATPMLSNAEHTAPSVGKMGVDLTAEDVAAVIWRAAHGRRTHWPMGAKFRLLMALFWLLPLEGARRTLVKLLTV